MKYTFEQKVYDMNNVIKTITDGVASSKTELPEAVGRTLPWDYDGTV
jgi:hypothetical protein